MPAETRRSRPISAPAPSAPGPRGGGGGVQGRGCASLRPVRGRPGANLPSAALGRQAAWGAAGCAWTPGAEDARGAAQESRPRLPGF